MRDRVGNDRGEIFMVDLKEILLAGDVKACLDFFEDTRESKRKALQQQVIDLAAKLAEDGQIDRSPLVSSVLEQLSRADAKTYRFLIDLHDVLKPSSRELTTNVDGYIALMSSTSEPVVEWALDILIARI